MRGPGGEELREGDGAEGGVNSAAGEVFRLEVEGLEGGEVCCSEGREVFEELVEGFG